MTMLSEHPHEYMNESGWVNIVNNSVCNSRIEVEIDREKKMKRKNINAIYSTTRPWEKT